MHIKVAIYDSVYCLLSLVLYQSDDSGSRGLSNIGSAINDDCDIYEEIEVHNKITYISVHRPHCIFWVYSLTVQEIIMAVLVMMYLKLYVNNTLT